MGASKQIHATVFFLLFISITLLISKVAYSFGDINIGCPELEKQSLAKLKQSLKDPKNHLSSWDVKVDCCKWKGVVCRNHNITSTAHVHQLYLQNNGLSGNINPSLVNLKHLRHLDLSLNNFEVTIPSFIGSLTHLKYLNLSDAGFHGKIPHTIGNLSFLHTLDLNGSVRVTADSIDWLYGLSRLEYLNLNYVDLSKAADWFRVINRLPSLTQLHFAFCNLDSIPDDIVVSFNLATSLTFLDLSHNKFNSYTLPSWIFQLKNLLHLDLSFNNLNGPIPTLTNATKLQYIDLSKNHFNSTIPDWLYWCKDLEFVHFSYSLLHGTISNAVANLTSLKTLDFFGNNLAGKIPREISQMCKLEFLFLTYNAFEGDISDSFGNMSQCFLTSLKLLCMRGNRLSGQLTDQFGDFTRMQHLHFGGNSFSGEIPASLGKLKSLVEISLYGNKFTGNLPESFGQLSNLEDLYADDNVLLEGVVTENHFANLTKLKTFTASGSHLTLNVSSNWVPPFKVTTLRLGSWNLLLGQGARVLLWLETQKNTISELDLSKTGISGEVPSWFWEIRVLNLSHNHLYGEIPPIIGLPNEYMYLSSNQFSGSLPQISHAMKELDLSNNSLSSGTSHLLCGSSAKAYDLEILHLGGNQLSGKLPDCWMKWPALKYLNIGNNAMFGSIPNSMGFLSNLQSLNLYGNRFSGDIPFQMQNCTELVKMELSENDLDRNIPTWVGKKLLKLKFLILSSNKMKGEIPREICELSSLQILDLSHNKLSGAIPSCVCNFNAMATKRSLAEYNYSQTFFIDSALVGTKGSDLQYDTILSLVTSIDLSSNNLSGYIPKEITSLVELRSLNLSRNHFSGPIPHKLGDMKQLEYLDLSRNALSGHIPDSLSLLSLLSHLDLSFNNLTGRIPESTQLLGLDGRSFIGNDVCGPPLTRSCSHGNGLTGEHEDDDGYSEIEWFYVSSSLGYAVGFSAVCATLVLNKSWREVYFQSLEHMWSRLRLSS
ncbi:unnamed protein product [Cuscuta epithymum]|uniref:Leucine-rich repeat-containing N-terminal plant-type domain-containing protein n=1 Tax=Cuscuta epithymum TaxID=186058 RepID=A0AAV0FH54_9ASTE|nr:unnamed protein product [Cuscuta epithymum]